MKTLVICEPGSTPEGDIGRMLDLVTLAADLGVNVFKNQWTSSPERMCERRRAPDYLEAYEKIAYPVGWHGTLRVACTTRGMKYAASCYLPEDVATLAPYVDFLKVASFEASDPEMIEAIGPHLRRTIISTGMMTYEQVRTLPRCYAILHCVSSYVTPDEQANIGALRWLANPWGAGNWFSTQEVPMLFGYSDHSTHPLTGALAVAAGASVVEFHLRDRDCAPTNPDYAVSRDPDAAREYVRRIREAETLMGDGVKKPQACEAAMQKYRVTA